MSLPKENIPKSSSYMSGSFVLSEGFLDHIIVMEAASGHERRWRKGRMSRNWLRV